MWIDIGIIAILCLCSAIGFKKGMLASLFSIVVIFLSIYLTYLFLPYLTSFILNTLKVDTLQSALVENNSIISEFVHSDNILFVFIKKILHIDEKMLLNTIVEFICNIVVFFILSFIINKMLKFVAKKISIFVKGLAIIGSFDRMCGLLFGFLKGIIFVALICFVISGLNEFDVFTPIFSTQISSSSLYPAFKVGSQQLITTMSNIFK